MKRLLRIAIGAGAMIAGVCLANEPDICTSICATEKRECRAQAQRTTVEDTDPAIWMGEPNRVARDFGEVRLHAQEARVTDARNFHNRRMERIHACDEKHMQCSNACASQRPAPSSILIQPEKRR